MRVGRAERAQSFRLVLLGERDSTSNPRLNTRLEAGEKGEQLGLHRDNDSVADKLEKTREIDIPIPKFPHIQTKRAILVENAADLMGREVETDFSHPGEGHAALMISRAATPHPRRGDTPPSGRGDRAIVVKTPPRSRRGGLPSRRCSRVSTRWMICAAPNSSSVAFAEADGRARSARVFASGGIDASTQTSSPSTRQRGASIAACGFCAGSEHAARTCVWPCGCIVPPMTPNERTARRPW